MNNALPNTWHGNKLRLIPVEPRTLMAFIQGKTTPYTTNVPADAQIVGMVTDPQRGTFTLTVFSNMFLPVPPKSQIPYLEVKAFSLTDKELKLTPKEAQGRYLDALDFQVNMANCFMSLGLANQETGIDVKYLTEKLIEVVDRLHIDEDILAGMYKFQDGGQTQLDFEATQVDVYWTNASNEKLWTSLWGNDPHQLMGLWEKKFPDVFADKVIVRSPDVEKTPKDEL